MDVLLVVAVLDVALDRVDALAAVGFEHRANAFAAEREHLFFWRMAGGERTHHLHVLTERSSEPDDYRLFRDFLRANPDEAALYQGAKIDLADRFARDRTSYVAAKEPIVAELLVRARDWRGR